MSQAIKDFVTGMGQALDLGATMEPRKDANGRASQGESIRSYWAIVGKNMERSAKRATKHATRK